MSASRLFLLPLAGEGGLRVSEGRMRAASAWAASVGGVLDPSIARGVSMILHRPPRQLSRASAMRSAPTKAEDMLWRSLRSNGLGSKFRRQVPIGPYVADFACLPAKLVVELDGPPHDKPMQQTFDGRRDAWFTQHGWRVLRVPNEVVFGGGDMVLDSIKAALPEVPSSDPASPGHLLPQTGEGRTERN